MTEKIPISFNHEDIARVKELIDLMGIVSVYGDFPKAVKFGITLALSAIKNPQKVYSYLEAEYLDTFFQSVARFEKRQKAQQQANKILETAQKV